MSTTVETYEFQTEARQLLDLMIHSVYSNKDIFLRELISNSSDALDKRQFEALKHPEIGIAEDEMRIEIIPDTANRTLAVDDNGIGMSRDEVVNLIGTIAKSGTKEFFTKLKESKEKELPELIGQFGVGFYSSFMVSDKVSLLTRRAGEEHATLWESTGDGTYTLQESERAEPGTTVTLHLKAEDSEDGMKDYTTEWVIREIVKQYSDFVAYPIQMDIERKEIERDEEGKPVEGAEEKTVIKTETLNSMKAIWLRPKQEVTEEEYNQFYKHISHDWSDPLQRIQAKIEGILEYSLLLFLPSKAPFDMWHPTAAKHGVHLYVKRVFIMDDCKELLPEYLRFVRGVVDSEDLSLNISREMLQQNRQIQRMSKGIVSKVLASLKELRDKDRDKFLAFWNEFGRPFKEGLLHDMENQETLLELSLFRSTHDPAGWCSLNEYLERMKPEQEAIYFMTGETKEKVLSSPHLEAFQAKGYEVLIFTDTVDEIWPQHVPEFQGKKLQSVGRGEVELGTEEEKKQAETNRKEKEKSLASLLDALKKPLDEHVKEVRLSSRLTQSAACLITGEHDLSPQLEQIMKSMGQQAPHTKRILELNPEHPILEKLKAIHEQNNEAPELNDYANLLYGQAVLAEGGDLPDPASFSKLVSDLMVRTV